MDRLIASHFSQYVNFGVFASSEWIEKYPKYLDSPREQLYYIEQRSLLLRRARRTRDFGTQM